MSIKEQLTLASGLAVLMSTAALWPLFAGQDWLFRVLGAVIVVTLAGLLSRRLGVPRLLQPLVGALGLAAYLAVVFAGSTLSYGIVPTGKTIDLIQALVMQGRLDIEKFGPPVPTNTGLVLLTTAGVGAVALLVDLVAVVLDRAAVAGLPLLLLFAIPSAVLPGGLGGLPFVLGAIGWLGLLMVEGSERVGRWGTPMRSSLPGARPGGDDSSLGRVGRRIGFAAVGMAVLVPLVVPGLDQRLVGGGSGSGGEGAGSGSNSQKTYNPITRLRDQLTLPEETQLFQYRTTDKNPDYFRMTTLDRFNGDGWDASELSALQKEAQVQKGIKTPVGDGGEHRDFTATVAIDGDNLDVFWLPVPYGPTKIDVDGPWLWDASAQTVFSAQRSTKGLAPYKVEASRVLPDRDALALAEIGGIPPEIRTKYGADIRVAPFVQQLTARLTDAQPSAYDKAVALQSYFTAPKNGFVYNFQASQPQRGEDALTAFLQGKNGFCEQYATSMAAMLRVAGIPSRVAVGFTSGTKLAGTDDADATYSVTTSNAHAWPEAWFAGTGWVRFEPTPAASGASTPDYSIPAVDTPVGPEDPGTAVPVPTATPGLTGNGRLDEDLLEGREVAPTGAGGSSGSSGPPLWLVVPVAVAVLLTLPFLLTLLRRRRRWAKPGPLTAWAQLRDDANDVGHDWHPADSPRTAAARLADWRRLPAAALVALEQVAVAAERARYAPPGRQASEDLSAAVATVRSALQETAPARDRLRAKYLPASTLVWVTHGIGERIADLLDKVDEVISAVTRPIRRRATATR